MVYKKFRRKLYVADSKHRKSHPLWSISEFVINHRFEDIKEHSLNLL